ncbi:hypothetical protein [Archangium sp.]|uniref:hypothetical protein n=1 Tax=Archangium sp. TaxID=1872627 RepID=UPI00389B30EE
MMSSHPAPSVSPGAIAITGLGLTTSIGLDVVASCASARAGVTRWMPLDIEEPDIETLESIPLKGHAVRGLTDGFEGLGRLIRLGNAALADLVGYSGLTSAVPPRTGFFVCLPGDFHATQRLQAGLLAGPAPDEVAWDELQAHFAEQQRLREKMTTHLMSALLSLNGLSIHSSLRACFFGGPAAFSRAVEQAVARLLARELDRCIVGGIDSYVHGAALADAYELGLLRTEDQPSGFFPGEAAAFLLLERADAARARGARTEALLGPVATAEEPFHRFTGVAPQGVALATTAEACLRESQARPGLVIVNLNGDDFRSRDFGGALVRLGQSHLPEVFQQWYPPASFGEIGAATGAASVCLAVRGFVRDHAGSRSALVLLQGDDEARGALLIEAVRPSGSR